MSILKRALTNARRHEGDGEVEKAGPAQGGLGSMGSGATYGSRGPSSPFSQTAGITNSAGANPLPRPDSSFGSLFGPGSPLYPDALDPLRPEGRADPRRYQYQPAVNLQLADRNIAWS